MTNKTQYYLIARSNKDASNLGGSIIKGLITKLIGGLYTVRDESNNSHKLKARVKFRHTNESPVVGDRVLFDEKFITEILERKNILNRPPLANIDQAIIMNSCLEPDFTRSFLIAY